MKNMKCEASVVSELPIVNRQLSMGNCASAIVSNSKDSRPTHNSRFTTHNSRFTTHFSSFIIHYSLFILFFFCLSSCMEKKQHIYTQKVEVRSLQEDFDYFRLILESAHPGLYQYTSVKDMQYLFDSTYKTLDSNISVFEFYNKLAFISNKIHCGHTSIFFPDNISDSLDNTNGFFPVPLAFIEGNLVVNSEAYDIPLGSQIISINNEPVENILASIEMYEPVDGFVEQFQLEETAWDFPLNYFYKKGPQKSFLVKYIANNDTLSEAAASPMGNRQQTILKSFKNGEQPHISNLSAHNGISSTIIQPKKLSKIIDKGFDERYYAFPEDVGYDLDLWDSIGTARMNIHTFGFDTYSTDRAFTHFLKNSFRLLQASPRIHNLIIDLRNNTGGNFQDMFNLYSCLTNRHDWREFSGAYTVFNRIPFTPYLAKGSNDVDGIQASLDSSFKYEKLGRIVRQYADNSVLHKSKAHFSGHVFVVTNTNVQSAAAYFAALLKDEGRAKMVGSETGGSGTSTNSFHILTYELPHTHLHMNVPVVHASFYLQNENHTYGHGVIPNYYVPLSLTDLKENNDPQISYILDSLIK